MNHQPGQVIVVARNEAVEMLPDGQVDLDRWQRLAERSLRSEGVDRGELNLLFVDAAAMADLNEAHMDGDGPTDVLAFPLDGAEAAGDDVPVLLGDVVVCPQVARRNAEQRGVDPDDELALLVVHGVLHVLGHDHAGVDDTARMQSRERSLLQEHHRP